MYTKTTNNARGQTNPFAPQGANNVQTQTENTQEAVVVDVIVNDKHPEYSKDGYNVGAVKFRYLKTNHYRDTSDLNWALPLETNITSYPLLNEAVIIVPVLNRYYYAKKVNTSSRVTSHALFGLNEELSSTVTSKDKTTDYKGSAANPKKDADSKKKLGKYFVDNPLVSRLKHDEGDLIIEGRSGQSIRFGAAWKSNTNFKALNTDQSPNLLMRVGPDPKAQKSTQTPEGLVVEDINKDASSIWMVSDQAVQLSLSTEKSGVHKASIDDFPARLTGNQIIMNTDRFVVNSKKDKIMGFSYLGIHWTTNRDFTVDADRDYTSKITRNSTLKIGGYWQSTVGSRHSFISPKIYVGSQNNESQPLVCGAELANFVKEFLNILTSHAADIILITGPTGQKSPLNPIVVTALKKLQSDAEKGALASFNSRVGYTVK
jgi:hypothetical protein